MLSHKDTSNDSNIIISLVNLQADTNITLTSSNDNTIYGQDLTITATIAAVAPSTNGGTPTGHVPSSACVPPHLPHSSYELFHPASAITPATPRGLLTAQFYARDAESSTMLVTL